MTANQSELEVLRQRITELEAEKAELEEVRRGRIDLHEEKNNELTKKNGVLSVELFDLKNENAKLNERIDWIEKRNVELTKKSGNFMASLSILIERLLGNRNEELEKSKTNTDAENAKRVSENAGLKSKIEERPQNDKEVPLETDDVSDSVEDQRRSIRKALVTMRTGSAKRKRTIA
jgi:hypothetical protein